MSGGAPPNAMKGFAGFEDNFLGLPPPNCGGTWSTDTGNSTPPPPSVPKFMGVIVSSMVTQSGSIISGDIKQVIVVQTDPGYAPGPRSRSSAQCLKTETELGEPVPTRSRKGDLEKTLHKEVANTC